MSKSLRYLGDGESFSFDHAKVHSPSKPAQRFADGGAVARVIAPEAMRTAPAPAPAPRRMDNNAVAGKAALGGYLLGEAKGVQESRSPMRHTPMAPSAAPAQPLPSSGFAKGGAVGGMLRRAQGGAVEKSAPANPKLSPMVHVTQSVSDPLPNGGFAKGGAVRSYATGGAARSDAAQDKAVVKKGIRQHENYEHGGKHTPLALAKGGKVKRATKHAPPKPKGHNAHAKPMRGALSAAPPPVAPPSPMMASAPAPMPQRTRAPRPAPAAPDMGDMATQSPAGAVPRLARGGKAPCR